MKHLKLYEKKFNKDSLRKFAEEKDELYSLIREYSIINKLYDFDKDWTISDFYYEYNVSKVGDEVIIITVINNYSTEDDPQPYMISDLYDLNRYIENPKTYNTVNKFNL